MEYRIVERDLFTVIGKATAILSADKYTLLPQFWETCTRDGTIAQLHKLTDSNVIIGVGENGSANSSFRYMIGVEANPLPVSGFDMIVIPKSRWVVFEPVLSEPQYVGPIWEYIFGDFLPKGQYDLADTPDLEVNQKIDENKYTCEIWIPVVRKRFV